jgi:nickel superoxide dismutase
LDPERVDLPAGSSGAIVGAERETGYFITAKKEPYTMTKTRMFLTAAAVGLWSASLAPVFAHCEIPCGIYTDTMRIQMIEEDCQTIEKSMEQIKTLNADPAANANQLIRWVTNKEEHANKIQEIVTQYFMTQRIKPGDTDYAEKLTLLHQMLIEAMKTKQTTDAAHVAKIRELSAAFAKLYFSAEDLAHIAGDHSD